MVFPDFPFPDNLPSFMAHTDVLKYFEEYAAHFDLYKYIQVKSIWVNITFRKTMTI